jgi:hypothetical protein
VGFRSKRFPCWAVCDYVGVGDRGRMIVGDRCIYVPGAQGLGDDFCSRSEVADVRVLTGKARGIGGQVMSWSATATEWANDTRQHQPQV